VQAVRASKYQRGVVAGVYPEDKEVQIEDPQDGAVVRTFIVDARLLRRVLTWTGDEVEYRAAADVLIDIRPARNSMDSRYLKAKEVSARCRNR